MYVPFSFALSSISCCRTTIRIKRKVEGLGTKAFLRAWAHGLTATSSSWTRPARKHMHNFVNGVHEKCMHTSILYWCENRWERPWLLVVRIDMEIFIITGFTSLSFSSSEGSLFPNSRDLFISWKHCKPYIRQRGKHNYCKVPWVAISTTTKILLCSSY